MDLGSLNKEKDNSRYNRERRSLLLHAECVSLSRFGREFKGQILNIQWQCMRPADLYRRGQYRGRPSRRR